MGSEVHESEHTQPQPQQASEADTAIFCVHGMGQQVRFETIETIASSLADEGERRSGLRPKTGTEIISVGEGKDGQSKAAIRAFVDVPTETGPRRVHIYEAYWAPLTEGKVLLKDAFDFLVNAARSGAQATKADKGMYERFMFGSRHAFRVASPATQYLLLNFIWALLLAMTTINGAILAIAAAQSVLRGASAWPGKGLVFDLTMDLLIVLVPAVLLGLVLVFQLQRRGEWLRGVPYNDIRRERANSSWLSWLLIWLVLIALVIVGGLFAYHLSVHQSRPPDYSAWQERFSPLSPGSRWAGPLVWVAFGLTLFLSRAVRGWMLQYIGDLAVYLSSNRLSRFSDIRDAIQKTACDVARGVYATDESGNPIYERVIVVGHSLGSVIAYDAINAVFKDQMLRGVPEAAKGPRRTPLFLTCGCPLDKTAFIFRAQRAGVSDLREQAAALVQPMIQDYEWRPQVWINIWTRHDPISGPVDYYDYEQGPDEVAEQRVRNWEDVNASVPFAAHSHYFENPLLKETLFAAVAGQGEVAEGPEERFKQGPGPRDGVAFL